MAEQSCEELETELLRKKGYCWRREETLLLIFLYQEMKELFTNVNYKNKTSVGDGCFAGEK